MPPKTQITQKLEDLMDTQLDTANDTAPVPAPISSSKVINDANILIDDILGNDISDEKKQLIKEISGLTGKVLDVLLPIAAQYEGQDKVNDVLSGLDFGLQAADLGFKSVKSFEDVFKKKAA